LADGSQTWGRSLAIGLLAAGCLLLGACSKSPKPTTEAIASLRTDVQKTVKDPARAAQALGALDSVTALIPVIAEFQHRASSDMRTLLRHYDATRADFDEAISRWEADRASMRGRVLAAHESFKRALTDAEWKKLQGKERKIVFQYPVVQIQVAAQSAEGER